MDKSIIITFSIILSVLIIAQIAVFSLSKLHPEKNFISLKQRINNWWGMVFMFIFATLFNPVVSVISLGFLCFFALREYFGLSKLKETNGKVRFFAYSLIVIQFFWILIDWYPMFLTFIPIYAFLLLPIPAVLKNETNGFLKSVSAIQWGMMLLVFGISHVAYVSKLSPEYGSSLVLFLIVLTQINDVSQYLWSKFIKGKIIASNINPYKTWKGFFFALLTTTATSLALSPYFTPLNTRDAIVLGILISIFGFIGSFNVSALKRDLESVSNLENPKNGFVLDKIDSLSYTAPIFFHFMHYFYFYN